MKNVVAKIPKSSFLYRFIIRFVLLIIIPVLVSWWIYSVVLNDSYVKNTLDMQQVNIEKSIDSMEKVLGTTSNVALAIKGNTEMQSYLNYYTNKTDMLYTLIKNIRAFIENVSMMSPYIVGVKIYSEQPDLLYADPFENFINIPLEEEKIILLHGLGIDETFWNIVKGEDGLLALYGYQKIYTDDYSQCVGYLEVEYSNEIFVDYFSQVYELIYDIKGAMVIYQQDDIIYTIGDWNSEENLEKIQSGYKIDYFGNKVSCYFEISELDVCIMITGDLGEYSQQWLSSTLSSLFTVIVILLLVLFVVFFTNVARLSKRILEFSDFMRRLEPDNLTSFFVNNRERQKIEKDELDVLIESYNHLIRENTSLISQVQKMELLSTDAKYQALQAQIQPHFIYGTLENIRMMAMGNDDDEVAKMVFALSELLRYSMSITSEAVTLRYEKEIANHYLTIQKIRFDERLQYEFCIEEKLLDMKFPSFILQPIVENAITYGISNSLEPCTLKIEVKEEEKILIQVSNTGKQISEERLMEVNDLLSNRIGIEAFKGNHNGLALYNIKERLRIFFGGKANVELQSNEGVTIAIVTIDLP